MTIDIKSLFGDLSNFNPKMVKAIIKAIAKNHQSEMDYLKFKHSVLSLQKMDMDEPMSIKSAFATLQTMGVTKDDIIKSIHHYSVIVKKEKEEFAGALKSRIASKIDKPTLDAQGFDTKILKKKEQIEKLKMEIELIEERKLSIGKEIKDATLKITETRDQFSDLYEYFAKQLDNDKILYDQLIN